MKKIIISFIHEGSLGRAISGTHTFDRMEGIIDHNLEKYGIIPGAGDMIQSDDWHDFEIVFRTWDVNEVTFFYKLN